MTQDNFFFALRINQPDALPYNKHPFFLVSVSQNFRNDTVRRPLML
jgi:hypothetical protein